MKKGILLIFSLTLLWSCEKKVGECLVENNVCLTLNDSLRKVVTLDTVRVSPVINELILNGKITFDANKVMEIYPVFGGNVVVVNVELGDYVKKGDVLAVIKSGEVADYEMQLKEANQEVLLKQHNFSLAQDMFNAGMTSERDLSLAKRELNGAETEQKRINEVFDIYNMSDNSKYIICSPMTGIIVYKNINREMQIRSDRSDEIFTISGLEDVWIMANVYESDISKVKEANKVKIKTLAYPNEFLTGTVDKVYNIIDEESNTMSIRIKMKNDNYRLKPGMFATVYVECEIEGKIQNSIKSNSLIFNKGKYYVVVVNKNNSFSIKEVEIEGKNINSTYIANGLDAGDVIVNKNALLIYNAINI